MSSRQEGPPAYENASSFSPNESSNAASSSDRATPTGPRNPAAVQFTMPADTNEPITPGIRFHSPAALNEAALRRHITEVRDKATLKRLKKQIVEQLASIELQEAATNPNFLRNQQPWNTMREAFRGARGRLRRSIRRYQVSNRRDNNSSSSDQHRRNGGGGHYRRSNFGRRSTPFGSSRSRGTALPSSRPGLRRRLAHQQPRNSPRERV